MPIGQHSRLNWEFYAVVKGRCGILLESGDKLPLMERCLWVFPPHHIHGWHGERRHCHVVVLHTGSVPRQLISAIPAVGFLVKPLSDSECRQIQELARALEPDFHERNSLSELRVDRALIDLTLLAIGGVSSPQPKPGTKRMTEKVDEAIAWFRHHLRERPAMEEVAAAVHVSPSHLRRLFMTVLKQNPRSVLGQVQIEVAMRLLASSDLKIESIAAESGFASSRDFARVFSSHQGCSPSDWRRTVQPPYAEPGQVGTGARETAGRAKP
jgi:AraC family transcriptional regulator